MKKLFTDYKRTDTIICWLKQKRDLSLLLLEGWYRIPVKTKLENLFKVKFLGFYQPISFGKYGGYITHYGTIEKIQKKRRIELFPKDEKHPKRNDDYFKIFLKDINVIKNPLRCKRKRANYFINSTLEKLLNAKEFNDIFNDSYLEEVLWSEIKKNNIVAERQLFVGSGINTYRLDFAAFCKKGNLDIECDGDTYHIHKEKAIKDNNRNNYLTRRGWSILRYTTEQVKHTEDCIEEIKDTIKSKGGPKYT